MLGGDVKGGMLGGAYSFVACLRNSSVDHASLSRRSTASTPNIETLPKFGRLLRFFHVHDIDTVYISYLRPVSPSAATIYLLYRIAIVFSGMVGGGGILRFLLLVPSLSHSHGTMSDSRTSRTRIPYVSDWYLVGVLFLAKRCLPFHCAG